MSNSKPLPGAWSLITDTWKFFTSTWNTSVKTSILFLYVGVAYFLSALLIKYYPNLKLVDTAMGLAGGILIFWIIIRLVMTVLNLEAGKQPLPVAEESKKAWSLFLPLLWVSVLSMLVVLGTSLLFIVPGIYFGVAIYFADMILIDQGVRGTQALAASRALVKGRWWAVFGRVLAGGFVFAGLMALVSNALLELAKMLTGTELFRTDEYTLSFIDPLAAGISMFIQTVVWAALMPLFLGFEIKLYRALQKTR